MKPCLRDWFPVLIQCLSLEAASRAQYETGFPRSSSGSQFLRWDVDRRGADFLAAEKSRCMTDSPWSLCLAVSESPARSKVLHQAENQNDKNNIYVNNMQRSLLIVLIVQYDRPSSRKGRKQRSFQIINSVTYATETRNFLLKVTATTLAPRIWNNENLCHVLMCIRRWRRNFFLQWPWTLVYDFDSRIFAIGKIKLKQRATHVAPRWFSSKLLSGYTHTDKHTHTRPIALSEPLQRPVKRWLIHYAD